MDNRNRLSVEEQLSSAKWQYRKWVCVKCLSRLLMAGDAVGAILLSKHIYDNIETISRNEFYPEAVLIFLGAPMLGYNLHRLSVFAKKKHQEAEEQITNLENEIPLLERPH